MAFNGTEGAEITIQEGQELRKNFEAMYPEQYAYAFIAGELIANSLEQEGSMGIRFYYGVDGSDQMLALVFVSADADENDMLSLIIRTREGTPGEEISLEKGSELTSEFQTKFPEQIKASFVGRDLLEKALEQEGAIAIKFYYGMKGSDGMLEPVLIAVDANGNDLLGVIIDNSSPCPLRCSVTNPLNTPDM